ARQSCEGVGGNEGGSGASRDGVGKVLGPPSDRDEEIPRHDAPRVDLNAGEAVGALVDLAETSKKHGLETDHAGALNLLSVSRATSRSSNWSFVPAISCPCS